MEPQLLHVHSVQGQTQTLNIVESTTHQHSRKKTRLDTPTPDITGAFSLCVLCY